MCKTRLHLKDKNGCLAATECKLVQPAMLLHSFWDCALLHHLWMQHRHIVLEITILQLLLHHLWMQHRHMLVKMMILPLLGPPVDAAQAHATEDEGNSAHSARRKAHNGEKVGKN
jgi:hypothetical protein